jgi:hypothetical protein
MLRGVRSGAAFKRTVDFAPSLDGRALRDSHAPTDAPAPHDPRSLYVRYLGFAAMIRLRPAALAS